MTQSKTYFITSFFQEQFKLILKRGIRTTVSSIQSESTGRGDEIVIKHGMTASADIKAMQGTVLSYLTKAITKTLSEGLGER